MGKYRTLNIPEEPLEEDDNSWALSFADLMSLLAVFFMVLFTTDNMKSVIQQAASDDKIEKIMSTSREEIIKILSQFILSMSYETTYMEIVTSLQKMASELDSKLSMADFARILEAEDIRKSIAMKMQQSQNLERQKLFGAIFNEIQKITDLDGILEIIQNRTKLQIILKSTHFYKSGSAKIKASMLENIEKMATKLLEKSDNILIKIEGHTDSRPISPSLQHVYPTNWELSTDRAISLVKIFEKTGFKRSSLVAIGHADSKPRVPEKDLEGNYIPENLEFNRRVEINIFQKSK